MEDSCRDLLQYRKIQNVNFYDGTKAYNSNITCTFKFYRYMQKNF